MRIEFEAYATIRDAVGQGTVRMEVPEDATLGEALRAFADDHDGVAPLVFDGDGEIRPNVNVLHNDENVRAGAGTATGLSDGDTVTLAPGIAGGSV